MRVPEGSSELVLADDPERADRRPDGGKTTSGVIFCYNQTMPRELLGKIEKPRGKNSG